MSDEQVVDTDGQAVRVGSRIAEPAPGVVLLIDFDERINVGVHYDEPHDDRSPSEVDEWWPAHPQSWNDPIVCDDVRVAA